MHRSCSFCHQSTSSMPAPREITHGRGHAAAVTRNSLSIWEELMKIVGDGSGMGAQLRHAVELNQAVDVRTRWSAPRQREQPPRHTQGDSPRRTNGAFLYKERRRLASQSSACLVRMD